MCQPDPRMLMQHEPGAHLLSWAVHLARQQVLYWRHVHLFGCLPLRARPVAGSAARCDAEPPSVGPMAERDVAVLRGREGERERRPPWWACRAREAWAEVPMWV